MWEDEQRAGAGPWGEGQALRLLPYHLTPGTPGCNENPPIVSVTVKYRIFPPPDYFPPQKTFWRAIPF